MHSVCLRKQHGCHTRGFQLNDYYMNAALSWVQTGEGPGSVWGEITYWFFCAMVPHWFNTQRHIEASNELYQSLDTFLPCLPRHCVSSMFVSKVLGFPLSITNLKHYGVYRKIETFIIDFLMISRLLLCLLWHYLYFLLIFF